MCASHPVTVAVTNHQCYTIQILLIYCMNFHVSLKVTYRDCKEIVDVCKEAGVMLAVCHVLRYTAQALKLRELINSGAIGEVVSIQHMEPVCGTICFILLAITSILRSLRSSVQVRVTRIVCVFIWHKALRYAILSSTCSQHQLQYS